MSDFREYSAAFHYQNGDVMHFGILGMKWGIRRYQNEDGTLTAAGRKRYDRLNNYADNVLKRYPNNIHAQKVKKKAAKYGTPEQDAYIKKRNSFKTDEEKDSFERDVEQFKKDGWKLSSDSDSVEKEINGHIISLRTDKNGSFEESKKAYETFKKNEKEHVNKIIDQILKNERWDNWTDDPKKLEKELRNAKNAFEFNGYDLYGCIGNNGIPELGYHGVEIEYDILSKKLHQQGLIG